MDVYPYKFQPIYVEKIWGGRALERLFARSLSAGASIGESWELADLDEGESVVANGPDAGKTLNELMREKGPALMGGVQPLANGRFPLLLKLLDANDILSLQVHPDADAVARLGPPAALKTECWYVVESREGFILEGVAEGVTKGDFEQVLAGGDDPAALERMARRIDAAAGDFHWLPAGTLHALGAGVVVAEIQTPSDTTYRVSDWGRGREIHVSEAMQCIHFESTPPPPGAGGEVLVRCPFFAVRKRRMPAGETALDVGSLSAWMVLAGRGRVNDTPLAAGDTVLLAAGLDAATLVADEAMTLLDVTGPE